MRTILYTACFGDHDKPAELPARLNTSSRCHYDYCCFTDDASLTRELKTWNVQLRRRRFLQPRMDAKWYKMSAGHLFPDHDRSIYIDASIRIRNLDALLHQLSEILPHDSEEVLAFYSHPEGQRSLEQEAEFSLSMGKYQGEPLMQQAAHYRSVGFPGGELLAGGVIFRKLDAGFYEPMPTAIRFEKAWFDECVHWSVQDQISLPYVLWKQGVGYRVIPGNIYDNPILGRVWSGPDR